MFNLLPALTIAYSMPTLVLFAVFVDKAAAARRVGDTQESRYFSRLALATPLWPLVVAALIAGLPFTLLWLIGRTIYWAFGGKRD